MVSPRLIKGLVGVSLVYIIFSIVFLRLDRARSVYFTLMTGMIILLSRRAFLGGSFLLMLALLYPNLV
jgi:hypothetical protein